MSQASSWDNAERVALVMEYSKPFIHWAVPTLFCHVLSRGLDHETPLRKMLENWHDMLKSLTETQKMKLEAESPGIVARMTGNLDDLDQMMAVTSLTLKTDTYFGLVIPWTEASDIVKHAAQMFKAAEGDFTRTSRRLWQDKLKTVQATNRQAVENSTASASIAVEMGNLPTSAPSSAAAPATGASVSSSTAMRVPPPRIPVDAHLAYRSAAALTATLRPVFFRQGRSGPPYSHGLPV